MKIQLDSAGNPTIVCLGKGGTSVSIKMDAITRDFHFYMAKPAKGANVGKMRAATMFKSDKDLILFFSLGEIAAFTIADAIVMLRNWEPEEKEGEDGNV